MGVNVALVGQFITLFALIMGFVSYYFGRRKTKTPILAGVLGVVLSILPLLGFIYLAVLIMKKDVPMYSETLSSEW